MPVGLRFDGIPIITEPEFKAETVIKESENLTFWLIVETLDVKVTVLGLIAFGFAISEREPVA